MPSKNTTDRLDKLQSQLLKYFDGDKSRLIRLAESCEIIGFRIRDNIDAISKHPEQFSLLITYSDLGILSKLTDSLKQLKEVK